MTQTIVPREDAYGTFARASAAADFLELVTLRGRGPTPADLADYLGDSSWKIPDEQFVPRPGPEGDDEDEGEGFDAKQAATLRLEAEADRVFTTIRERMHVLGTKYPFGLDATSRLVVRDRASLEVQPYLALLSITTAHAYKIIVVGHDPKQVFEETVASVLASRGMNTVNFGKISRASGDFITAANEAGRLLSLPTNPGGVSVNTRAQDQGVDTIGHFPWDDRSGKWNILGQVTCAQSDAWDGKISEPKPDWWGRLLGGGVHPLVFLAIPHHAEPAHLHHIVDHNNRMVLDRLRLVKFKGDVSVAEVAIVDAVSACAVEYK